MAAALQWEVLAVPSHLYVGSHRSDSARWTVSQARTLQGNSGCCCAFNDISILRKQGPTEDYFGDVCLDNIILK